MHTPSPVCKLFRFIFPLILFATSGLSASDFDDAFRSGSSTGANAAAAAQGVRIVSCDEKVVSRKRGICMNEMSQADFKAIAPGVSWYYNWHYETKYAGISGPVEFLPMLWGNRPEALRGLEAYLSHLSHMPRAILAINEPNLRGQAFISPEQTAKLFKETKEIANRHHIPIVGPNMSLGSPEGDSIKAMDPVENKEMTYTFMVPFLKAFMYYVKGTDVPALAFHSYGSIGELKWAVEMMHKEFNRPIWVTEYAEWKNGGADAAKKYLIDATDFLERTPYVQGYAWFKERVGGNPSISLFEKESGKLTPMGQAYVSLPAHDENVYYRIPGRLQAENFAVSDGTQLRPTADTDGQYQMAADTSGGTLDYNLQVDAPGTYRLTFRVAGVAGKFDVMQGEQVIGSAQTPDQNEWHAVETQVRLNAGMQKLRIRYSTSGMCLNWIEFSMSQ